MKLGQVLERFFAGDQLRKFPHLLGGVLVGDHRCVVGGYDDAVAQAGYRNGLAVLF